MIFASTYPVSDDPTPYLNFPYDGPRTAMPGTVFTYSPRPEYDRSRVHDANPILRAISTRSGSGWPSRTAVHARKVLDRLDRMIGPVFRPEKGN